MAEAAQRTGTDFVDRTLEQLLDLIRRHLDELFGQRENLAHANTNKTSRSLFSPSSDPKER
jgi:hypothetical protein